MVFKKSVHTVCKRFIECKTITPEWGDVAQITNRMLAENLLTDAQWEKAVQFAPARLINKRQFQGAPLSDDDINRGPLDAVAELKRCRPDLQSQIDLELEQLYHLHLKQFLSWGRGR